MRYAPRVGVRRLFGMVLLLAVTSCGSTSPVSTTNPAGPSVSAPEPEVGVVVQDPTVALEVVGKLLNAVIADDRSQIGRHLGGSDSSVLSAEQLENVFRFATASGWVDEVEGCEANPQEGRVLGVVCRIVSGHPIFGSTGDVVVWNLSVEGDKVIDADPTPYLQNTSKDQDFFQWLIDDRPTSTLERCDPDSHEPSEVVVSEVGYPLDARCGAYLAQTMPEFFVATDPDHPVAVWYRFDDAFDGERLEEVMEFFAEDALMEHLAGTGLEGSVTYVGQPEIRGFFEYEFDAFPNYERVYSDFFVEGSFVRFKMIWGPAAAGGSTSGQSRGGAIYESVVEDGLIHQWVEVERLFD